MNIQTGSNLGVTGEDGIEPGRSNREAVFWTPVVVELPLAVFVLIHGARVETKVNAGHLRFGVDPGPCAKHGGDKRSGSSCELILQPGTVQHNRIGSTGVSICPQTEDQASCGVTHQDQLATFERFVVSSGLLGTVAHYFESCFNVFVVVSKVVNEAV